jgi:RND family efflux transporter MFP subunit
MDKDLSKLQIQAAARQDILPRKRWVYFAAAALLLLILFYFLFSGPTQSNQALPHGEAPQAGAQVSKSGTFSSLNATGYVVAQRRAAVSSKATGRLKDLKVVEGDRVKKDDVLGVLENEDLIAAVKERQANIGVLEGRIKFAQAEFEDAKTNLDRATALRRNKVVSQAEFDQAQARFRKAQSDLESSHANLELSKAQLDQAKIQLSYTYILAPFDGTVLTKNADVGEVVAPFGSSANARAAIVTLADMSSLQVEADVSEQNMTRVSVGQEVEIVLDSLPDKAYRGVVDKIVPTVDRAKGTVLTKIRFNDLDSQVIPEMSARVAFKEGSK